MKQRYWQYVVVVFLFCFFVFSYLNADNVPEPIDNAYNNINVVNNVAIADKNSEEGPVCANFITSCICNNGDTRKPESKGDKYAVSQFPKEKCQYPSMSEILPYFSN